MRKNYSYFLLIIAVGFLFSSCSLADNERKMVREGNKAYNDSIYDEAEILYRKALDYNPTSFAANYNIANTTYKQKNYKAAVPKYKRLLDSLETKEWKSATLHNLGNSYLHTQEIDKAIEAYKESLRHNPNDMETKYNLVYAMNLKQQQQNQQQQQQNNQQNHQQQQQQNQSQGNDKKEDQKSEQDNQPKDGDKETKPQPKPQEGEDEEQNNEQQEKKDNKGKSEQDKDQQGNKGDEQENQQPKDNPQPIEPKEGQADENGEKGAIPVGISKEEAENLLDAIAVEEKQAQEKVQKDKARKKGRVRNKKNW